MGKKGQNKIPERWEKYCKIGNRIPGTKFVCFKVPLKEELCRNKTSITRSQWFTPADLLMALSQRGESLGLLIDLTNTDRYYDPAQITYTGTKYVKVNVTGQELPTLKDVKEFFDAVDNFEEAQDKLTDAADKSDLLIGVHCTHGVNRTGYLVCRYLIERKGWSAKKAVHEFNTARGHQIEKEHYLAALREAERNFHRNQAAQVDVEEINLEESSSSSSEEEDEEEPVQESMQPESLPATSTALPNIQGAGPLPMAGWQLFQQMMVGVAQMQAMMGMPGTMVTSQPSAQESSSDEETSEEESSEEESEEGEQSDDDDKTEKSVKNEADAGRSGDGETSAREGWELGGKVELKPKMSKAQKRRARRRERREEFKKMRKGKFWEIREMQKEKYGI